MGTVEQLWETSSGLLAEARTRAGRAPWWASQRLHEPLLVAPHLHVLDEETLALLRQAAPAALVVEGVEEVSLDALEALLRDTPVRALGLGLRTLGRAEAQLLSGWRGTLLSLPHVTEVSEDAARTLARWPGKTLRLGGLSELGGDVARALCEWSGRGLELDGLTRLDDAAARSLGGWPGQELELRGLAALGEVAARALGGWPGAYLHLDGLRDLSEVEAAALGRWLGKRLQLDGLAALGEPQAAALAGLTGLEFLSLGGLDQLDEGAAQRLATWPGRSLRMGASDSTTAKALRTWSGSGLWLRGTGLDEGVARELAGWTGTGLTLRDTAHLDAEAAWALSAWRGRELVIEGLTEIDAPVARALAAWSGVALGLPDVERLGAAAAAALSLWRGRRLGLRGVTALDEAAARALGAWPGETLDLTGLTALTEPVARALAARTHMPWLNPEARAVLENLPALPPPEPSRPESAPEPSRPESAPEPAWIDPSSLRHRRVPFVATREEVQKVAEETELSVKEVLSLRADHVALDQPHQHRALVETTLGYGHLDVLEKLLAALENDALSKVYRSTLAANRSLRQSYPEAALILDQVHLGRLLGASAWTRRERDAVLTAIATCLPLMLETAAQLGELPGVKDEVRSWLAAVSDSTIAERVREQLDPPPSPRDPEAPVPPASRPPIEHTGKKGVVRRRKRSS